MCRKPISGFLHHFNPKKKHHPQEVAFLLGAGYEARTHFPASHELPAAIRRNPASPLIGCALRARVEAARSLHLTKKQDIQIGCLVSVWSGLRGSNSLPGIPRITCGNSQEPCLTSDWMRAPRTGGGSAFSSSNEKTGHPNWMSCFSLERATRLELATSTLARWRSTR